MAGRIGVDGCSVNWRATKRRTSGNRGCRRASKTEWKGTEQEVLRKTMASHLSEIEIQWYIRAQFEFENTPLVAQPKHSHAPIEFLFFIFSCLFCSLPDKSHSVPVPMSLSSSLISFSNLSSTPSLCLALSHRHSNHPNPLRMVCHYQGQLHT